MSIFSIRSLAPGVGTTVPGGATYREAHLVMELLHDSGLVRSVDIVELNPFLDERGRTARTAVELIGSLFGQQITDRPTPDQRDRTGRVSSIRLAWRARRRPDTNIIKVAGEDIRCAGGVGQRHIAVGPQQIKRIAGKPRRLIFRSPAERVQRHVVIPAPCRECWAGRAVEMDLPIHAGERSKIVGAIDPHPGQAIAAMHLPGCAAAQRTAAIIQHHLRDGPEQIFARTAPNAATRGISSGAIRVRRMSAILPSAVAKLKTRSVVATSRRAKPIRSAS